MTDRLNRLKEFIINLYLDFDALLKTRKIRKTIKSYKGSYDTHIEVGNQILYTMLKDTDICKDCIDLNKNVHNLFEYLILSYSNNKYFKNLEADKFIEIKNLQKEINSSIENIVMKIH